MKTVGIITSEAVISEEKSISNDTIRKLLTSTGEDKVIGVCFLYKKYPQLYNYTDGVKQDLYVQEAYIREYWTDFDLGDWSTPEFIGKALGLET